MGKIIQHNFDLKFTKGDCQRAGRAVTLPCVARRHCVVGRGSERTMINDRHHTKELNIGTALSRCACCTTTWSKKIMHHGSVETKVQFSLGPTPQTFVHIHICRGSNVFVFGASVLSAGPVRIRPSVPPTKETMSSLNEDHCIPDLATNMDKIS